MEQFLPIHKLFLTDKSVKFWYDKEKTKPVICKCGGTDFKPCLNPNIHMIECIICGKFSGGEMYC